MLSQKRRCTLCIIEHFGNADAVPQPPERRLSRKAGIMRCCLRCYLYYSRHCGNFPDLFWKKQNNENISIKCERGFKPFSHYFFTESEVQ